MAQKITLSKTEIESITKSQSSTINQEKTGESRPTIIRRKKGAKFSENGNFDENVSEANNNEMTKKLDCSSIKNIEMLLSYVGCGFPHFTRTVLPLSLIYFVVIFTFKHLDWFDTLYQMKKSGFRKYLSPFSKHTAMKHGSIIDIAKRGDLVGSSLPYIDFAIILAAFISIFTIRAQYKHILWVSLGTMSFFFLVASHLENTRYLPLFVNEISVMIFMSTTTIMVIESVPKFHRTLSYLCLLMSGDIARIVASFSMVTVGGQKFAFYDHFYNSASAFFLITAYFSYFFTHDTLYNLLSLGKFVRLEKAIRRYLTGAKIQLPASKIVDYVAFENFEPFDSIIEVFLRTCKSRRLVYEVIITGLLSAMLDIATIEIFHELDQRTAFSFFDISLVGPIAGIFMAIFIIAFAYSLPKLRIIPAMVASWFMYFSYEITVYTLSMDHEEIFCESKAKQISLFSQIMLVVCVSMLKVIRFYAIVHLMETVPSLTRLPVLTFTRLIQLMAAGTATEVKISYKPNGLGYELLVIPMLILSLVPVKRCELPIFFKKSTHDQKTENLDPEAPIVN